MSANAWSGQTYGVAGNRMVGTEPEQARGLSSHIMQPVASRLSPTPVRSFAPRDTRPSMPAQRAPIPAASPPAPVVQVTPSAPTAPVWSVETPTVVPAPTPAPAPVINNYYSGAGTDPNFEAKQAQLEQDRLALEKAQLAFMQKTVDAATAPSSSASAPGGGVDTLQPPADPYTANDSRIADLLGSMFSALGNGGGAPAPMPQQPAPAVIVSQPTGNAVASGGNNKALVIVVILALGIGGIVWYQRHH